MRKKLIRWISEIIYKELTKFRNNLQSDIKKQIEESMKHYFGFCLPLFFANENRIFIHTVDKQRLFLDTRELFMTLHLLEHGEWETHVRHLLRTALTEGSTFVDIGANIGVHTLFAAALVGKNGKIIA